MSDINDCIPRQLSRKLAPGEQHNLDLRLTSVYLTNFYEKLQITLSESRQKKSHAAQSIPESKFKFMPLYEHIST